jgi:hypothetical protein
MLGSRTTLVDYGTEALSITVQERDRVEPQSRKHRRTVQSVGSDQPLDQPTFFGAEPKDFVRVERSNDVLPHSAPLIVIVFGSQIDEACRLGDFNDKFRRAADVALAIATSASALRAIRSRASGSSSLFHPKIVVAWAAASKPGVRSA